MKVSAGFRNTYVRPFFTSEISNCAPTDLSIFSCTIDSYGSDVKGFLLFIHFILPYLLVLSSHDV